MNKALSMLTMSTPFYQNYSAAKTIREEKQLNSELEPRWQMAIENKDKTWYSSLEQELQSMLVFQTPMSLLRTSRITFNPKRQMNCSNMEKNAQYRHKYS